MTDSALAAIAAGPFTVACSLLVVAGGRKLVQPAGARAAIAGAGLPLPRWSAGAVGAVELAAGGAGIAFGAGAAAAVALLYLALAGFAWRLLRRAPATPCACLGSSTATVSRTHVLIDLGAVIVALAAASGASPLAALGHRPMAAVLFVALVACCVQLVALTLDVLPALAHAVKEEAA
ncbi:MAG TPA: MauE/DoxX family redox-associated membrane protein [Acidimicrobiia bacterium]